MPAPPGSSLPQPNPSARRILGVDPGLRCTGWGLLVATNNEHLGGEYGVIKPPPTAPTAVRLHAIMEAVLRTIDRLQPHVVAVERPFLHNNVRTAMALGQAQAAILLAAAQHSLPVFEYAPREVKQAVSGDGNAEKSAVAEALRLRLNLAAAPQPDDASDALAVAYCHYLLAASDDPSQATQ